MIKVKVVTFRLNYKVIDTVWWRLCNKVENKLNKIRRIFYCLSGILYLTLPRRDKTSLFHSAWLTPDDFTRQGESFHTEAVRRGVSPLKHRQFSHHFGFLHVIQHNFHTILLYSFNYSSSVIIWNIELLRMVLFFGMYFILYSLKPLVDCGFWTDQEAGNVRGIYARSARSEISEVNPVQVEIFFV